LANISLFLAFSIHISFLSSFHISISLEDYSVTVNSCRAIPILNDKNGELIVEKGWLTGTSFKYGILSINSKGALADALKQGDKVKVKYGDAYTTINIGSKKGRLTGLTSIFSKHSFMKSFDIGDEVLLKYSPTLKLLEISKPETM